MTASRIRLCLTVLALPVAACTGQIDGISSAPSPDGTPGAPRPTPPITTPTTPAGTVAPPVVDATPPAAAAACSATAVSKLLPTRVWRLSPEQYLNTVSRVFGVNLPLTTVSGDGKSDAIQQPRGFDTDWSANKVYDALGAAYADNAEKVAAEVMAKLSGANACAKAAGADQACLERFVRAHAEPAFRRPLDAAETGTFVTFYKTSATAHGPEDAARMVLEAILQSPHFVYRSELGASAAGAAPVKLTQHELAAQLSYFIADVPPVAVPELVQAAQAGQLDVPSVVKSMAQKLVQLPEARAKLKTFFTYYMPYYREFLGTSAAELKDPKKFPTFAALKPAMQEETSTFLQNTLATTPTLKAVFGGDHTYLNGALAAHYGVTTTAQGSQLAKTPVKNRAGLLTQAGVIAAMSQFDTTSPVHRGLFYFQSLLCNTPGTPDPNAATQFERLRDPTDPRATERQKYDYFVKNEEPICVVCHQLFHPLGLGLERFDPIGRYRTTENDRPIDPAVELTAAVAGAEIAGRYGDGIEALNAILGSDQGRACFVEKYVSFAFGVDAQQDGDPCTVKRLAQKFGAAQLDLTQLLVEATQESAFFFRQAAK